MPALPTDIAIMRVQETKKAKSHFIYKAGYKSISIDLTIVEKAQVVGSQAICGKIVLVVNDAIPIAIEATSEAKRLDRFVDGGLRGNSPQMREVEKTPLQEVDHETHKA